MNGRGFFWFVFAIIMGGLLLTHPRGTQSLTGGVSNLFNSGVKQLQQG